MVDQLDIFGNSTPTIVIKGGRSKKAPIKAKEHVSKDIDLGKIGLNANWKNFEQLIENRGNKTP